MEVLDIEAGDLTFTDDERREKRRWVVNVPATVHHRPGRRSDDAEACVVDLHSGGALIETSRPLDMGDWITIRIPHFKGSRRGHMTMRGRVQHGSYRSGGEKGGHTYGIKFARDWRAMARYFFSRTLSWATLLLIILGVAEIGFLKTDNLRYFWYHPFINTYGLLVSGYILSRFALACFYRPPERTDYEPTVSVIIACKNEESSIYRTLRWIFKSDYPLAKLQVIAVNDGSTDGTLKEMRRAKHEYPSLEIINFERNLGKRHGMAAGTHKATGEILVFVDSDSFVKPDAIRELVTGFVDPEVGAVCGHANVENVRANLLTKMQEVRYFVAFRVVKAAESLFSAVTCCSGCLSAYRRSYLMEFLDHWLAQRFLGREATFGDDRSLTNYMLRRWRVIYNSRAVCSTIVPEEWGIFFRQQLRWKKSWIRESFLGMRFMWKKNPILAFSFYFGVLFPLISPLVVANAILIPLFKGHLFSLQYVFGTTLMATLFGLVYFARYRSRIWFYGIWFSFLYMFVLVWQVYYACLTVRRSHWGTR